MCSFYVLTDVCKLADEGSQSGAVACSVCFAAAGLVFASWSSIRRLLIDTSMYYKHLVDFNCLYFQSLSRKDSISGVMSPVISASGQIFHWILCFSPYSFPFVLILNFQIFSNCSQRSKGHVSSN